ncbi:MAG: hypothetical protein WAQ53_18705 [Thiofilum sp.]|uniref:hypothetical protein n=1 Tax=Thiofilum sp. TaxID=2212733 RepID=UPI0025E92EEE|nr:hypothetical protein [Thiofilum sp.]MBK8454493.1 hypothetical protein [Thiofilum sp.]
MKIPTSIIILVSFLLNPAWSAERRPIAQFQVAPLIQAKVIVADRMVLVSINNQALKPVAPVNPFLWQEYQGGYIKYGDFDKDKVRELALLTSISYGGINPCYYIYHYNKQQQRFLRSGEPMRCNL